MAPRVAVEDGLRPIKEQLRGAGFEVVSATGGIPDDVVAIVVNGLDDNLLGRQDLVRRVPVVNAQGKSAQEVAGEVHRRLRRAD